MMRSGYVDSGGSDGSVDSRARRSSRSCARHARVRFAVLDVGEVRSCGWLLRVKLSPRG